MVSVREGAGHPLRSAGAGALRLALVQVVVLSVVLAAVEIALLPSLEGSMVLLATFSGVGVLFVAAGAVAWARRPSNRMGPLLALAGFATLLAAAGNTTLPLLATPGEHAALLPLGVIVHLLLAFPSGRLRDRRAKLLTAAAYVSTIGVQAGEIHGDDPAAWAQAQSITGAVIVALTAAILVRRIRGAAPLQQRTLTPLYAYGTFTLLFLVFSRQVLGDRLGVGPFAVFGLQQIVVGGIPLAFLAGVLRGGFSRTGEIEELATWLGTTDGSATTLRDALAATLGDPTLDLCFRLPDAGGYVDAAGSGASATALRRPAPRCATSTLRPARTR